MGLSVIVNTKNAANTLRNALESCTFAEEVIVVDMESSDQTVEIAKQFTKKIFSTPDKEYVEPARNFAISKATQDWIFILDADEQISPDLQFEIKRIVESQQTDKKLNVAYAIARKNMIWHHWFQYTGWWPDYQIRLFKMGTVTWSDQIHSQPTVSGKLAYLPAKENLALIHQNYKTVEDYLEKLNRYTSMAAMSTNEVSNVDQQKILSSFWGEFCNRFFVHRGYQDGLHGLSLSLMQANYQLTVLLKQWQKNNFQPKPIKAAQLQNLFKIVHQQLNYYVADVNVKIATNPLLKFYWQVKRKFKI